MARVEWIKQRLDNWARWKDRQQGNGLGFYRQSPFLRMAVDGGGYRDTSIPVDDVEAGKTDRAVQALRGPHPHLFRTLELIYLEDMSGEDGDNDYLDRHVTDEGNDPLSLLQDHRMRHALVEAIKNLPEREQYVMSMYYEQDMNLKEIAAVLGVTESRICQLHSQSIARLRAKMRAH